MKGADEETVAVWQRVSFLWENFHYRFIWTPRHLRL